MSQLQLSRTVCYNMSPPLLYWHTASAGGVFDALRVYVPGADSARRPIAQAGLIPLPCNKHSQTWRQYHRRFYNNQIFPLVMSLSPKPIDLRSVQCTTLIHNKINTYYVSKKSTHQRTLLNNSSNITQYKILMTQIYTMFIHIEAHAFISYKWFLTGHLCEFIFYFT